MSAVPSNVGAITMFVDDPQRSKAFYQRVFELTPIFEDDDSVAFGFEGTIVNLLRRPAARSLIEPAAVAPPGAGSSFQLTIWLADADVACALLVDRGVELLNGPLDREWGVRTAAFADPDGHVWEIAQKLGDA